MQAISDGHWGNLVQAWNKLKGSERQTRSRECTRIGHDYRAVLFRGKPQYVVCLRCFKYDDDELDRLQKGQSK